MKKILILLILISSFFIGAFELNKYDVEAASSYYSSISDSATGSSLKSSLRSLITSTHSYKSSYNDCKDPNIVVKTDGNTSGTKIVLFWSEIEVAASWDGGTTWNREHVWPQSKGWFETSGAGSDLHHIRPSDPSVNSSHNNNPYGEVSQTKYCTTSSANGSKKIQAQCYGGIFEPGDDQKGDTARIIFYLLTRYSESDSYSITNVATSMDMLLKWNEQDPVDDTERRRNEAVYNIQGNRNPFIDDSYYAELIWGNGDPNDRPESGSGSGSDSGSSSTTPTYPTDGIVAKFEFGANDTTKNDSNESSSAMSTYTETNNNYTLVLNNLSKVYTCFDQAGNSCLKLGTSSIVGGFDFDVPGDVDQVIILVAGYKANSAQINVNGTTKNISTYSNAPEYTNVVVDTSNYSTVSISTTSSGYRCKINSIIFYDLDESGSSSGGNIDTPVDSVTNALNSFQSFKTNASLVLDYEIDSYAYNQSGYYSYTFTSKVYSDASKKELNGIYWDPETTLASSSGTKYYGYDSTKGQQFGSEKNPFSEVIFKTSDNILDGVTTVTIQASGASSTNATISAYVGTSKIGETQSLTSSNKTYTFTNYSGLRGNVKFVIKQTSSKAIYIKGMTISYAGDTSYISTYSLNSASIRLGSYLTKDLYNVLNNSNTLWGVEYASGTVTNWQTANVLTAYCTPAQVSSVNATTTSSTGNYYQWALVIRNLNYSHLDKTVTARVFVEYNGVRYYMNSTTVSVRSLAKSYLSSSSTDFANHTAILEHLQNY